MAEEQQEKSSAKTQNPLVVFLIFLIVIGLLALTFFFGLKYRPTAPEATLTPTPTPEITGVPSPQVTPTPTITTEITPTSTQTFNPAQEESLIKQAVFQKTGLDETKALVTINKNTSLFATGGIKEYEAVGGAYWLAAKTPQGWVCVYDGQSQPTCAQIAPYNFPKDMVPECLDENGKVITR